MKAPPPLPVRLRLLVGSLVLIAGALCVVFFALAPTTRRPVQRVAAVLASGLVAERPGDLEARVSTEAGLSPGLPAWLLLPNGDARPIAHVVAHGRDERGPWVRLRFEPGEEGGGPWALQAYAPDRSLSAALQVGLTQEEARAFGGEVATRLERLWREALLPEAEQRLPAFLARIDPARETEARAVLHALSDSALTRLDPLLDELTRHVTAAIKERFDMLDRVGLLWKVVKGDAEGLQRQVMPVAKAATKTWWDANQARVLDALGGALQEQRGALQMWIGGELFDAARSELFEPVLAAQRTRLEREGEALLREAADAFVRAPGGGFRVRFASVLRTQLLRKDSALLLLRPTNLRPTNKAR